MAAGCLLAVWMLTGPGSSVAAPAPVDGAAAGAVTALLTLSPGAVWPGETTGKLAALHATGTEVQVLRATPGPRPGGFAALVILTFPNERAFDSWAAGGAMRLGAAFKLRRADILAHNADRRGASGQSFYAVNHYRSLVTPGEYLEYTRQYVVPNMEHQLSTGAMIAYTMYIERESGGAQPHAVLVKEYHSSAEQARAEAAKEKYRAEYLLKQPVWRDLHERKSTIRVDLTETFASPE